MWAKHGLRARCCSQGTATKAISATEEPLCTGNPDINYCTDACEDWYLKRNLLHMAEKLKKDMNISRTPEARTQTYSQSSQAATLGNPEAERKPSMA